MDPITNLLLSSGVPGILALAIIYLYRTHAAERAAWQAAMVAKDKEHRDELRSMIDRSREDSREQIEFNREVIDKLSTMTESLERKVTTERRREPR